MHLRLGVPVLPATVIIVVIVLIQASNIYSIYDIPVLRDEAYYWLWSKYPATGYFDHPPMIAWILAISTSIFGDSHLAIRMPGILAWIIGIALIYRLTSWCFASRRAGFIAVAFVLSSPVFQILFNAVTPDTVLFIFVILYLLALARAVEKNKIIDWILLGLATGGLCLSKYTGVILPFVLALYLLFTENGRKYVLSPGPWLAALTSILVVSPLIWWNADNDWISFSFQLRHGFDLSVVGAQDRLTNLFSYVAGQLVIFFLPPFFIMIVYGIFWCRRVTCATNNAQSFIVDNCIWIFVFTVIFFGFVYTFKSGELNWTAFACVPALIVISGAIDNLMLNVSNRFWLVWLFAISAVLSLLLLTVGRYPFFVESLFPIDIPRTQITNAYGWNNIEDSLEQTLNSNADYKSGECSIIASDYSTASWLSWNLGRADLVQTGYDSTVSRKSQFDIWRKNTAWDNYPCFFFDFQKDPAKVRETVYLHDQLWYKVQSFISHNPDGTTSYFALYTQY